MKQRITRTAEHVSEGHPDKFCDQVADRILDEALNLSGSDQQKRDNVRTAVEGVAKDDFLILTGEVNVSPDVQSQLDVEILAREVWQRIGYGTNPEQLKVTNHIQRQSEEIGQGVDTGGAGDQGIMVGYATDETAEFMPSEWLYARNIVLKLAELRRSQKLTWLKADCKSQVTIHGTGEIKSVIVAAQHETPPEDVTDEEFLDQIKKEITAHVLREVLPNVPARCVVNGTGKFVIGGPAGDAGVVGRKIVIDAYGPRVPVGGGAYSGKDPTKVDRSAAYMARYIAKYIVAHKIGQAKECTVKLAYGIGQFEPEMITAITDQGVELSDWVQDHFPDLSPGHIIERFGLREPNGWSYLDTAAYGHYGREIFPWERVS